MTAPTVPHPGHLHPGYTTAARVVRVAEIRSLTADIKHLRLVAPDGASVLTPYQPGSHLIVSAGGHRNAYSLIGDGMLPTAYGISVLRRGAGGG